MLFVEGKPVFSEIHELVDPVHTALILVDLQRDFADAEGAFGQMGVDLSAYGPLCENLSSLLESARRAGVLVVHIQMTTLANRRSDSPAQIRFNMRMHRDFRHDGPPLRYTVEGTWGHEFIDGFGPQPGEVVVRKARSSAFWGTNLDQILRSNGIKSVVVTGLTTEGCVESTARDALFNDYFVVIAPECVASDDSAQHEASMLLMRHRFDIVEQAEIERIWRDETHSRAEGSTAQSFIER
jgi:nicotinamidase-related amidase